MENVNKHELISDYGRCIQEIQPDCIVLPNPQDAHSDHLITYEVGMSCSKIFRYPYIKKILTMEIISETDFSKNAEAFAPNYFVEAVRALALLRGGMAGSHYAEAFKIIKEID